jgi:hypothetical protein
VGSKGQKVKKFISANTDARNVKFDQNVYLVKIGRNDQKTKFLNKDFLNKQTPKKNFQNSFVKLIACFFEINAEYICFFHFWVLKN